MAVQLIRLNGAMDDEIEEIRALLESEGIDYYETPGGNWGVSLHAIWLRDEEQLDTARVLLEKYHSERAERVRAEALSRKFEGRERRFIDELRASPVRVLLYIAGALLIGYLSTKPFLSFGQ